MSDESEGNKGDERRGGQDDEDEPDARDSSDEFLRNVARVPSKAPPLAPASLVGARLDHFIVRAKLGEGGMGIVYEAEDEQLGRTVALKVLPNAVDPEARRRFVREARAASRIVHPNVATIYESGEAEQGAYIAMEYVRGATLREWLRTPRSVAARVRVVREIASALAEAHAVGIVHRDLKPDNVIVTPAESVKVLDFGLAKQSAGPSPSPSLDETATAEGRILGTPSYMSPEQAKGLAIDARSDVFSFGVLLYEVFTGERPFKGDTAMGVLIAIDRDEPLAPTRINAETPVAVERIIGRALEKKPAARYADGAELLRALQALEPSLSPPAPSARASPAPWLRAVILLGVLVEVVALVAVVRSNRGKGAAAVGADAAPAHVAGKALTDFPPYGSKNDAALEAYRRAQQFVRGAMTGGGALFERAATIDPAFGEAQLRVALYDVEGEDLLSARPHFREAKLRRSSLAPRDGALLDAFEPMIERSPADPHETAERMRAVAVRFPDDAEIAFFDGFAAVLDASERALPLFEHALTLDPGFARVLLHLTEEEVASGHLEAAERAIDRCLAIAPDSTLCLSRRAELDGQRGACAEEEAEARRMLTVAPGWMLARTYLGSALLGEGRSVTAVRELAVQGARQAEDAGGAGPAFTALLMEAEADLLEGDMEASLGRFRALEPVVAPLSDEDTHELITINEVTLLLEMGRDAEGYAVARDFLARHDAWEPNPNDARAVASDFVVILASGLRRAGILSKSAAEAHRATEIGRWMKRARTQSERELVWLMAYAAPADTPEEAQEAFAALPAFGVLPDTPTDILLSGFLGHALLLAGRVDDALPRLERATRACDLLDRAWPHLRASYDLGQAREAKGDVPAACSAYASVLARWANAKPRSVTGEKALARSKALRCGK